MLLNSFDSRFKTESVGIKVAVGFVGGKWSAAVQAIEAVPNFWK